MKLRDKLKQLNKMYQDVGYHKKFIGLFTLIIATAIIEIITIPYIMEQILDIEIPEKNVKGLIILVCIYIFIIMIQCYMILKHCNMRCTLSRFIKRDLRNKIFEKLQKVKANFFDENETGEILQLLQDDIQNAGELFPIIITEMFVMGLARFTIVAIFLITAINEGIQSFLTIKTLGIINQRIRDLEIKLEEYNCENSKLQKIISTYNGIFSFITSFSTIAIIYFGGMNVLQGIMTYAEIMLMIKYASSIKYEFNWFTRHLTDFNQSFFAYFKILELLEKTEEENLKKGEKLAEKITRIEFDKVSFSYNYTQKNIKNFSLMVEENQKVALIGKTGARKNNSSQSFRKII